MMMRLFVVVAVGLAMVGCGKDKSESKQGDKPTMKANQDTSTPGVDKPGKPGESGTLPATPVGKDDDPAGAGLSVKVGAAGVAVKAGADGVAVKAGADGVAVKTGADGVAIKTGADGVAVKAGADGVAVKIDDTKVDLSGDSDEGDDCVAKCVRANQMRAVGADQIDRDCKAECKKK